MTRGISVALVILVLVTLLPLGAAPAAAQPGQPEARSVSLQDAAQWLRMQQRDDGGFGLEASSGSVTADVLLALAAASVDVGTVRKSGRSILDYLWAVTPEYGKTPAGAAKLVVALRSVGLDPRAFGGQDLLNVITSAQDADGQYGQNLYEHGYAVLALAAANAGVNTRAVDRITATQIADGSWAFAGPGQPGQGDTNTTSLLVQALVAAGQTDSPALGRARDYLRRSLVPGGGFVFAPGQENPPVADANSTALGVQALLALDERPMASAWSDSAARLGGFQNPSGAFRWRDDQPADNLLATAQALPALALYYLPFTPDDATGIRSRRAAARRIPPFASTDERVYVPETGHSIAFGFKHYWAERGGWEIFGLPLTEEFREVNQADGKEYTVQYFERARFEYHPEHKGTPYETELGLLGAQAVAGRNEAAFARITQSPALEDCIYYEATGHAICGPFLVYWQEHGGLDIFGMPLNQPYLEGSAQVQYFQRARFEWTAGDMRLGLLGRDLLYRPRLAAVR